MLAAVGRGSPRVSVVVGGPIRRHRRRGGLGGRGSRAARLSEDPGTSLLLLEAGPDHTSAGAPAGLHSPNFFDAVMEPGRIWPDLVATRAAEQTETTYVRGLGAGGSSSINAMGAIRGTVDDYERWAGELGCAGWGWPEMLARLPARRGRRRLRRRRAARQGGPIPLWRVPLDELAAARAPRCAPRSTELGYPTCDDYHAPDATGISRVRAHAARRPARLDQRRVPRPRARRARTSTCAATRSSTASCSTGRRAVGVRLADGDRDRGARGDRQRGRDPLARDPAALGHRRRRRPARSARTSRTTPRRRASSSRCSPTGAHAVGRRAGVQLAAALLVGPRRRRAERHADRLVRRRRARTTASLGGGADHRRGDARVLVTAWSGCAPPTRTSTRSSSSACSTDARDLVRLRDGVRRIIDDRAASRRSTAITDRRDRAHDADRRARLRRRDRHVAARQRHRLRARGRDVPHGRARRPGRRRRHRLPGDRLRGPARVRRVGHARPPEGEHAPHDGRDRGAPRRADA